MTDSTGLEKVDRSQRSGVSILDSDLGELQFYLRI